MHFYFKFYIHIVSKCTQKCIDTSSAMSHYIGVVLHYNYGYSLKMANSAFITNNDFFGNWCTIMVCSQFSPEGIFREGYTVKKPQHHLGSTSIYYTNPEHVKSIPFRVPIL